MKAMDLQPAIDLLAQYRIPEASPCPTGDHGDYEEICQSSRGFECYRKEQLAKDLLLGCTGPSILIWGDGAHGYASAPTMRLRRLLSKYIPAILSSEYLSSAPAVFQRLPQDSTGYEASDCRAVYLLLLSRDVHASS